MVIPFFQLLMCALIAPELAPWTLMKSPRLSATSLAGSRWRSSQQRRGERGTSQGGGWMSMLWMWALKAFSPAQSIIIIIIIIINRTNGSGFTKKLSNFDPHFKWQTHAKKKNATGSKIMQIWFDIILNTILIPKYSRLTRLTWHDDAGTSARVGLAARAAAICACMAAIALASLARRRSRTSGCAKVAGDGGCIPRKVVSLYDYFWKEIC